jgi:glycosyltransferase involved in cell wall biosynthesis
MISPELDAGIGTWLEFVCPLLMKNHDVTLLTSDNTTRNVKCNTLLKLDSWSFPPKYYYMPKLKKLIKDNFFDTFDIIQIHGFSSFPADYLLLKKNKISTPIIFSPHGGLQPHPNLSTLRKIHDKVLLRFNWNNFNRITAISFAEKNRLVQLGFKSEKIDILYNGGGDSEKILSRQMSKSKIILYVGRLAKPKNVDLLIDAFSILDISNLELIIAGPDFGAFSYLQSKVQENNLSSKVHFKGRISDDEKFQLLSKSSVFVHPSLTDVFAITLIEASQAGVPCVAFDVGANREILEDGITGLLAQDASSESLASKIKEIILDSTLAEKLSKNGQEITPKKFNWDNTIIRLEEIFNQVVSSKID